MAHKPPIEAAPKSWLSAAFKAGSTTTLQPKHAPTAVSAAASRPVVRPQDRLFAKAAPTPTGMGLDSSRVRDRMIQRIAAQGTDHPAVLSALASVERHRFVDSALVNQAYEDTSLPIGLGQTISKPSVVARMLALLLENTAAMERLKGLHDKAKANLRGLQRPNIHLLFGDGFAGYPTGGPYAAIISAAGGVSVPQTWIDQLAVGGRLVAPTQTPGGQQSLVVIDKTSTGVVKQVLEPVLFVPLKSGVG